MPDDLLRLEKLKGEEIYILYNPDSDDCEQGKGELSVVV